MSRTLQLAIGLVVSVACLWLAMHDVRPVEVFSALGRANYLGFAALIALTLAGFWIRAWRWGWLFSGPRVPMPALFGATMIGFMANNLLPLRLGEFVRAWALGRSQSLSKTTVFATVVVERVIDMITLLLILGATVLLHPLGEGSDAGRLVRRGAFALVIGAVALTAFVILIERSPNRAQTLVATAVRPLPGHLRTRAASMLDQFIVGLALFRDLPRLAWVFLLSLLMFGAVALGLSVSLWAFGIAAPWYAGLVMLVVTSIGIMVPAAPGYIGTMNIACKVGLRLFGIGPELSVPFSWFYWAGQWIPVTLVGLYCARRAGLTLSALGRMRDDA